LLELKNQQINKLQDLKKMMDFKKNFNLLLNYSFKLSKISPNENIDLLFGEIDFEQLIVCAQKHQELMQKEKLKQEQNEKKEKMQKEIKLSETTTIIRNNSDPHLPNSPLSKSYTSIGATKLNGNNTNNENIKNEPVEKNIEISEPQTPHNHKTSPGDIQQFLKEWVGPTTKPKIKRISEPKDQSVWWEKVIDLVMGEEDYALICGSCSTYHSCVPKNEKSQDFICRSCGTLNKNDEDIKVEEVIISEEEKNEKVEEINTTNENKENNETVKVEEIIIPTENKDKNGYDFMGKELKLEKNT